MPGPQPASPATTTAPTPKVLPIVGEKKKFVEPYSLLLRTAMGMEHEGIGIPPTDVNISLSSPSISSTYPYPYPISIPLEIAYNI